MKKKIKTRNFFVYAAYSLLYEDLEWGGGGFRRLTKQTTFARETKHESPVTMYLPAIRVQSREAYPPVLPVL